MTDDEVEAQARLFLKTKEPGIPWEVYYRALADLIVATKQMRKGLRLRNGRWRRLKPGEA